MPASTPRTPRTQHPALRLGLALAFSVGLHFGPFAVLRSILPEWRSELELRTRIEPVEIGLEQALEGSQRTPPAAPPPPPAPEPAPPPAPPPPAPPAAPHAPRVVHAPPLPELPNPEQDLLPAPRPTQLSDPQLQLHPRPPHLLDETLTIARRPPRPRDAGADAAPPPLPTSLPGFASAAGELSPAVPRGALVSLLLRTDHLRGNPQAPAIRRAMAHLRDWNMMLRGSGIDPLSDLDQVLLATANLRMLAASSDGLSRFQNIGVRDRDAVNDSGADLIVLVRGAGGRDEPLRRALERMAQSDEPVAPSPVNPGTDGGMLDAEVPAATALRPADAGRNHWDEREDGLRSVTLERWYRRRSFVMLGGGLVGIAPPDQVAGLAAAMARRARPSFDSESAQRDLALLVEADGLRNVIEHIGTWRGEFPVPRRLAVGLYQTRGEDAAPDGGAQVLGTFDFDDDAQATRARELFEYARGRWHARLAELRGVDNSSGFGGMMRGLLVRSVASAANIDLDVLDGMLDTLQFTAGPHQVRLSARWTAAQVQAALSVANLAQP